ncbi:MAG: hypothetical protein ACLFSV_05680 [Alkalispirochaeta sp.]
MRTAASLTGVVMITIFIAFVSLGCAGDPETFPPSPIPPPIAIDPVPAPTPPPSAEPEPEAEPKPLGHAPLVGTRWSLSRLHGDMRTLTPVDGPVWIEFHPDGSLFVQGPENSITGTYRYRPDTNSPKEAYNFEEGSLFGDEVVRERRPGSYSEFEDVLLENLQLLKGYYIRGESPDESDLTIWGGYRSEEVVLIELTATGTIRQ